MGARNNDSDRKHRVGVCTDKRASDRVEVIARDNESPREWNRCMCGEGNGTTGGGSECCIGTPALEWGLLRAPRWAIPKM
jgi:hypothetical protein